MVRNERFRIKSINIKKYYAQEYLGLNVSNIDGKSLFIFGTNNTGKTTSFDAIISSIFGSKFIYRQSNQLDDIEIILATDNLIITIKRQYHKSPVLRIHNQEGKEEIIEGQSGVEKRLINLLNVSSNLKLSKLMISALVLPQRDEDTILRKSSQDEMRSIVIAFSSGTAISEEINKINQEINKSNHYLERLDYSRGNIRKEINDLNLVVSRNNKYFNEIKEFLSEYRSGNIFNIQKSLEQHPKLKQKMESLTSTRTSLWDSLFKTRKEIGDLNQFYNKKLIESVKETLSVLMCPVCGDNLDVSKVEGRKNKKLCPFCGKEEYHGNLYEKIVERIRKADSKIEKLKKQEKEFLEKKEETEKEIEKLKQQNKQISKVNSIIMRVIKKSETDTPFENEFEEYKKAYERLKEELEITKFEINSKDGDLKGVKAQIEEYKIKVKELEETKKNIDEKQNKKNIEKFSETLNLIYKQLIKPLGHSLIYEKGEIYLDTGLSKKNCTNKTDLGYSQKRLVDVALWLTFHELNYKNKTTNLNFGLFDDIFENIDNNDVKWKNNLINQLRQFKGRIQLITFSIDKSLNSQISCEIEKGLIYQKKLNNIKK